MTPEQRHALFQRLRATNPEPTTELNWSTPFELLVAVLLSAQATDRSVNIATRGLFAEANTPQAMLALGEDKLVSYISNVNLHRTKAKYLLRTCQILLDEHDGQVPRTREALERLPGVGRKTANVVLNTAFGESTLAVDTHIFRVANRTGLATGRTPLAVELALLEVVPPEFLRYAHHWLLLHGRYICKARVPECWHCPIEDLCGYQPKTPPPVKAAQSPGNAVPAK